MVGPPFISLSLGRHTLYLFTPLHAVVKAEGSRCSEFGGSPQGNGTEAALFESQGSGFPSWGGAGRLYVFLDFLPPQKCILKNLKIYLTEVISLQED